MTTKKGTPAKKKRARETATPREIANARRDETNTASGVQTPGSHQVGQEMCTSDVTPGRAEPERSSMDRTAATSAPVQQRGMPELTSAQIATAEAHNAGLLVFKCDSLPPADEDTIYIQAKDNEQSAYVELTLAMGHIGKRCLPRDLVKFTIVDALPEGEIFVNERPMEQAKAAAAAPPEDDAA